MNWGAHQMFGRALCSPNHAEMDAAELTSLTFLTSLVRNVRRLPLDGWAFQRANRLSVPHRPECNQQFQLISIFSVETYGSDAGRAFLIVMVVNNEA
jgi:hypothetical protein